MAYDMSLFDSPSSTLTWLTEWATREFGSETAKATASIVDRYGQYAARRKYELLNSTVYSLVNYNEFDLVLAEWETLVSDAQRIYDSLAITVQPSFFELVLHPAKAGYILHQLYISTAKNNLYAKQGRVSAATYGTAAVSAFAADAALATIYHQLLGGKWNHMMDQTHIGYTYWQQPDTNVMPVLNYPATNNASPPGIFVEGGNGKNVLPTMNPYGPRTRWIDIYSKSNTTSNFTLTSSDPWVTLTPSSGTLNPPYTPDQRVLASISWATAPAGKSTSTISITAGHSIFNVTLPLSNTVVPSDFSGFVSSDDTIAIEPAHFNTAHPSYSTIPSYGKTLSGMTLLPISLPTQKPPTSPRLTYNFYTFPPTTDPSARADTTLASITVILSPSLNHNPSRPLAYAVAVNDEPPRVCQYVPVTALGTLPVGWAEAVEDAGWRYTTRRHVLKEEGANVLSLWLLEPGVVVQKIVIDLGGGGGGGGGVRTSYLGPPESMKIGV